MITKVDQMRNVGIFRNFIWGALPQLKRFNLIYGWNYSGKTTFSRVFQAIERGELPDDIPSWDFKVIHEDGTLSSPGTELLCSDVRVFNRKFIEKNLNIDMAEASPIVVIGEKNQKLKSRLYVLESRRHRRQTMEEQTKASIRKLTDSIDTKATDQARIISELFGDRKYNRRHLLDTVAMLPDESTKLLLTETERTNCFEAWRRAGDYQKVDPIMLPGSEYVKRARMCLRVLKTTASFQAIDRLKQNSNLEKWVREGLGLHSDKRTCEFCLSEITDLRWNELQTHFSKANQDLYSSINSLLSIVSGINCDISFPSDNEFFPELQDRFHKAKSKALIFAKDVQKQVNAVKSALERKKENLELVEELKIDFLSIKRLRNAIRECDSIIDEHKKKVATSGEVKENAKESLLQHYAAEYANFSEVKSAQYTRERLENKVRKLDRYIKQINTALVEVEVAIKNASIAPQMINDRLKLLLPDENIEAVAVSDSGFEFRRNGQRALNMSDGERTAVAFAYFLAKLDEHGANLSDLVIVIDDPICSFDLHHIYAVYSIVEQELSNAKQLIILTHNADFFSLIKDWMCDRKYKERDRAFYMVDRVSDENMQWQSRLVELPRLLKDFKTDYLFTYYSLKAIHETASPALENLCGVPNMLRRLLETYLGFRYPGRGAWHKKLSHLIDSDITRVEVSKFIDEFSHSQHLHRALNTPDYVSHCKRIIGIVLTELKRKDPEHIASLEAELADN